jgi:hypothetical protein
MMGVKVMPIENKSATLERKQRLHIVSELLRHHDDLARCLKVERENHLRAGITEEELQHLAALKSSRMAGLYERRDDEISIAEVE